MSRLASRNGGIPKKVFFHVLIENRNIVLGPYKKRRPVKNSKGDIIYETIEFNVCKKTGNYIRAENE